MNLTNNDEQDLYKLSKVLQDLELYISDKERILLQVIEERDKMYKIIQDDKELISDLYSQLSDSEKAYKDELRRAYEEKRAIQAIADEYRLKASRFDELTESVVKIKKKAEQEALYIVDNIQKQSMETVSIIQSVINEIKTFSIEIENMKEDLKIGQDTIEDRLTGIKDKLNHKIYSLDKISKEFYKVNGTTVTEDTYNYRNIANHKN